MFFVSEESSNSSDDERTKKQILEIQKKLLRQSSNVFNLPDNKFEKYFGLDKTAFHYVLKTIAPNLRNGIRSTFISKTNKLAVTLRFLATGSHQINVGNDFNLGLSQPMFSKILSETLDALETTLCPKWIKLKMTDAEKDEATLSFFEKTDFPGVFGCVEGTHIKITAPRKEDQHLYYNRKGFYSLNTMIICDHKMRIRFMDARFAGSSDESLIWEVSHARKLLNECYNAGERNSWLLGDVCYPLEPYLMVPYRSADEGSAEAIYNTKHAKVLNIVRKTIGALKNRFRCLLGVQQLNYKPAKATKMVNICAALHNICIEYNLSMKVERVCSFESRKPYVELENTELLQNEDALEIRDQIKQSFL